MTPTPDSTPPTGRTTPKRRWRKTRFLARWLRRPAKATVYLVVLAIVAASAWVAWTNHRGPREVARVIQDILDRGISLDRPDPIPEAENGARFYLAAGSLLALDESLYNGTPVIGMAEWPLFAERFSEEQTQHLREVLEPYEPVFKFVRRARDFDRFDYATDEIFKMQQASEHWGQLRKLARFLTLRYYMAVAESDYSAAVEFIRDQIHLAKSVTPQEGVTFNLAVHIAVTSIANGNIKDLLARAQVSETDLKVLAEDVQTLIQPDRFWTVSGEPVRQLTRNTVDAQSIQMLINMGQINGAYTARVWQEALEIDDDALGSSWLETWIERLASIRLAINPGAYQIAAAQEVEVYLELLDEIKSGKLIDENRIEQLESEGHELISGLAIQQRISMDLQDQVLITLHGLAAERHRLQHGDWPTAWDQIHTTDSIPVDRWGQPLRILKTDEGFRVYSLGENKVDNGGRHRWDDDTEDYEADDFNIRLLDPQYRGKPTTSMPLFAEDQPSLSLPEVLEELKGSMNEALGQKTKEDSE
ncbi:MAG: hypothetical protein AAF086_06275 [Planctomycetota bacterium]